MKKFFIGKKKAEFYKGMLVKADLGLHDQIAEKIQREVPAGAKVLDLGAGEGALSARLVDLGYQVTAVDKDQDSFKCEEATFSRIDFDSADEITQLVKQHEDAFDAVLGIEVIEHVQDQWQYVRQLLKMVKPGGMVLITTPNTTSWLSRLMFFLTGRFHQFSDIDLTYGHINPISSWVLNLILRESGARQIEVFGAGTLPPIYITGFNKLTILNLSMLVLRPFMSGSLDGWCVMATARKAK